MDERDLIATTIKKRIASTFPQIDRPDSAVLALCCLLIADTLIDEGFSRRPELDEEELIPFLLTLRTFYNKDGDVDLTAIAKSICANFTAPEAKQREVKWPEKMKCHEKEKCGRGYPPCSSCGWNEAIDACKKAYEEAQPSSSVNAELRSALEECIRVMIDNDEYGWSDDAIKQAEQALNSIKAGKDTK